MIGVLRNSGIRLEHSWYVDGTATDPDGPETTVGITRADDSVLVAAGTATDPVSTGVFAYTLAPQLALNLLTVSWTAAFGGVSQTISEQVEIVGGFYVSLAELKAMRKLPAGVTNDELIGWRRDFEDLAERYVGCALVPRYQRDLVVGRGRTHVQLSKRRPRTLLSVSVNGVVAASLVGYSTLPHGRLENITSGIAAPTIAGPNVIVEYEHGLDAPPASIPLACKYYVERQAQVDKGVVSRDVLYETDAAGITARFSTPDWDAGRPTGILDVDRTLNAVRQTLQSVG